MSILDLQAKLAAIREAQAKPKAKAPVATKTKASFPEQVRQWSVLGRYLRIDSQQCRCCGETVRFVSGSYVWQKSGSVTRRILESRLDPHDQFVASSFPQAVWEAEASVVDECAGCLGLTGGEDLDQLINAFERATVYRQLSLFEVN